MIRVGACSLPTEDAWWSLCFQTSPWRGAYGRAQAGWQRRSRRSVLLRLRAIPDPRAGPRSGRAERWGSFALSGLLRGSRAPSAKLLPTRLEEGRSGRLVGRAGLRTFPAHFQTKEALRSSWMFGFRFDLNLRALGWRLHVARYQSPTDAKPVNPLSRGGWARRGGGGGRCRECFPGRLRCFCYPEKAGWFSFGYSSRHPCVFSLVYTSVCDLRGQYSAQSCSTSSSVTWMKS